MDSGDLPPLDLQLCRSCERILRRAGCVSTPEKLRRCRAAPRRIPASPLRSRSSAACIVPGAGPPVKIPCAPVSAEQLSLVDVCRLRRASVASPLEIRRRLHRPQRHAASRDPPRAPICRTDRQWPPPTTAVPHLLYLEVITLIALIATHDQGLSIWYFSLFFFVLFC